MGCWEMKGAVGLVWEVVGMRLVAFAPATASVTASRCRRCAGAARPLPGRGGKGGRAAGASEKASLICTLGA